MREEEEEEEEMRSDTRMSNEDKRQWGPLSGNSKVTSF